MERRSSTATGSRRGATSRRLAKGTIARTGDWVATKTVVLEHSGQMCEPAGVAVTSAQKWNCAPRKATASSKARIRRDGTFRGMWYVRRSLGRKGCGVKQSVAINPLFITFFAQRLVSEERPRCYGRRQLNENAWLSIWPDVGATRSSPGGLRGDFVLCGRRLAAAPAHERRRQRLPYLPGAAYARAGGLRSQSSSRP